MQITINDKIIDLAPRMCDITGISFFSGYKVGDEYAITKRYADILCKRNNEGQSFDDLYEDGNDYCYWSEWSMEEGDQEYGYDEDGNQYELDVLTGEWKKVSQWFPDTIKIDFQKLKQDKEHLILLNDDKGLIQYNFDGLLSLIDKIQDKVVDINGMDEDEVFFFEKEENLFIKSLDFEKETFEVGKEYYEKDIIEMANRNNIQIIKHNPIRLIDNRFHLRKTALYLNFKEEDIDLWFIQVSNARSYRCVMFEN